MKNISALSLLLLLASTQMQAAANAELYFGLASQVIDQLQKDVIVGNEDRGALQFLDIMNKAIQFDNDQQTALANAKNGYLYNGTPLDSAKITADDKKLQDDIQNYKDSIKRLQAGGFGKAVNKKKIDDRRKERDKKQAQLDANLKAINDNQAAMSTAQTDQAKIKVLREKNALEFEHALESYITSYGQVYTKMGNLYGSSTIIASHNDQNQPITAHEYDQLVATLQQASNAFVGITPIMIALPGQSNEVTISQVASYVANLKPSGASWTPVQVGAAILGAGLVAVSAAVIGSNLYQGKDLTDTADIANLFDSAQNSSAGQAIANLWNSASTNASSAWNNAAKSSVGQTVQSWFSVIPANQQASVINEATDAMLEDPALALAAAGALVANNQTIADANPQDAAAQQALADSEALAQEVEYEVENYGKIVVAGTVTANLAAAGALLLATKNAALAQKVAQSSINASMNASKGFGAGTASTEAWLQSANAFGAATPTGLAAILTNAGNSAKNGIAAALDAGKNTYGNARNYLTSPSAAAQANVQYAQGQVYNNIASGTASAPVNQYLVSNAQGFANASTPLAQAGQNTALYGAGLASTGAIAGTASGANNIYNQYFSNSATN